MYSTPWSLSLDMEDIMRGAARKMPAAGAPTRSSAARCTLARRRIILIVAEARDPNKP